VANEWPIGIYPNVKSKRKINVYANQKLCGLRGGRESGAS
jgi:hypothetical protein